MASHILEKVKYYHCEIESYYYQITDSNDEEKQAQWQTMFNWELACHFVGEELVLYPAFERYLPDGASIVRKDRENSHRIKRQLKIFQKLRSSQPEFIPTIQAMMEDISQHIEEEESRSLPLLEDALSPDESARLSIAFAKTKLFVPKHCHFSAPGKPPFMTVIGLLTAPMDYLAQVFYDWPDPSHS